jgi:hypothetical protein
MSAKRISEPEFSDEETARRRDAVIKHMLNTPPKPHSAMKIGKRKAEAATKANSTKKQQCNELSQEFREWQAKCLAEEAKRLGPMLDAMLLEAQNLRLVKGHKARERTLRSLNMAHASRRRSQAVE